MWGEFNSRVLLRHYDAYGRNAGYSVAGTRKTTLGYDAATGIWSVTYNGENRPIRWERGDTVVTMDFDRMGRRTFYRETENGQQETFTRFLYDGYVMIQQLFTNAPYSVCKEFIWDPTESVATKPLCFREYGQADAYLMHDGNKNVTDVIVANTAATQLAHYEYAPFGAVRAQTGACAAANPYRFSSEFADDTLGLVYYNYRHYEPTTGRFMSYDIRTSAHYSFCNNNVFGSVDILGLQGYSIGIAPGITIPPPRGTAEVDGFGDMLGGGLARVERLNLKPGGRAYEEILKELRSVATDGVDIDCSVNSISVNKTIDQNYHFGGRLMSNVMDSSWGPRTYNFWTVGNAYIKGIVTGVLKKTCDTDFCRCFSGELSMHIKLTDKFDFIPDRTLLTADGFLNNLFYDACAVPVSAVYNMLLGASMPDVEADFDEQMSYQSCKSK